MAVKPRCYNCRHYQPSPLYGQGWCRNPLLHSELERKLVEANQLSCDKRFYHYWEPMDGNAPVPPPPPPRLSLLKNLPTLNPSQTVYYYAIAAILVVLGIVVVLILPTTGSQASAGGSAPTAAAGRSATALAGTPPGTPFPLGTLSIPVGAPRNVNTNVQVANTNGDGVCIRKEPSRSATCLIARPDGTRLRVMGADTNAEGRVWRPVEDERGNTGWVPAEYLIPAEP